MYCGFLHLSFVLNVVKIKQPLFWFGIYVYNYVKKFDLLTSLKQFKPCVLVSYYYVCSSVQFYDLLVLETIWTMDVI